MSKKLSACESALVSMVRQYCYRPLDANKEPAVDIYQHDFMSAGEEAFACLVNRGLAEWTDERRYAIRLTERADNPVRISPPSWLDYWWQEAAIKRLAAERDTLETHNDLLVQAIDAVTAERDEARDWARRMKRERDALKERCVELEARLDIGYGNLADIEPPKFTLEPTGTHIVNRSGTARPDYGHELTGQIGGTGD